MIAQYLAPMDPSKIFVAPFPSLEIANGGAQSAL
jgi:hypothetical protein